jgi:Asp/Glu/hydantoin racemase
MSTLLLLNPNCDAALSQRLQALAQPLLPPGLALRVTTARFGARYISGEAAAAVAAHAAIDAYAADVAEHGLPSAVLLACFGDPGLFALRACSTAPVLGLAEAAMHAAALQGPFVVLTGGAAWGPMLLRLASGLALPAPLLGVQALERTGAELAADPAAAAQALAAAARQALTQWPAARSVLLGGAGLAGLAPAVQAALGTPPPQGPVSGPAVPTPARPIPVLDNWQLAVQAACAAAQAAPLAAADAAPATPHGGPWLGLTPALQALLAGTPPPPHPA